MAAVRSGPADRNYAFLYDDVIPEERKGLKDRLKVCVCGGASSPPLHTQRWRPPATERAQPCANFGR